MATSAPSSGLQRYSKPVTARSDGKSRASAAGVKVTIHDLQHFAASGLQVYTHLWRTAEDHTRPAAGLMEFRPQTDAKAASKKAEQRKRPEQSLLAELQFRRIEIGRQLIHAG